VGDVERLVRLRRLVEELRDAEVDDLDDFAIGGVVEEHVVRLHVAVDDPGEVRGRERVAHRRDDLDGPRKGQLAPVAKERRERPSAQQFHDEIRHAGGRDTEIEHLDGVRMRDAARRDSFAPEPPELFLGVVHHRGTQHFHGDRPLRPQVHAAEHRTEATLADFLVEAVRVVQHRVRQRLGQRDENALGALVRQRELLVLALQLDVPQPQLAIEAEDLHLSADARQHLGRLERLRHVVIAARLERLDFLIHRIERRDEDDGNRREPRLAPHDAADFVAGHLRHLHVEEHEIWRIAFDQPQRVAAVDRRTDVVTRLLQDAGQQHPVHGGVVRDDDLSGVRAHLIVSTKAAPRRSGPGSRTRRRRRWDGA